MKYKNFFRFYFLFVHKSTIASSCELESADESGQTGVQNKNESTHYTASYIPSTLWGEGQQGEATNHSLFSFSIRVFGLETCKNSKFSSRVRKLFLAFSIGLEFPEKSGDFRTKMKALNTRHLMFPLRFGERVRERQQITHFFVLKSSVIPFLLNRVR